MLNIFYEWKDPHCNGEEDNITFGCTCVCVWNKNKIYEHVDDFSENYCYRYDRF